MAGIEWLLEIYGCPEDALRSRERLTGLFQMIVSAMGLKPLGDCVWPQVPDTGGLTGFWLLQESHLAMLPYTASQDVVQRYVTTPDQQTAARGIWLNALVSVPAQAVFFAIGTALFVFYKQQPAQLDVTLQNDAIFPFFIMSQLPAGVAGLIVAGIFAAGQSTLASSMISVATIYVTDFHHRLRPGASDHACLRVARWVTVLVGIAGTAAALAPDDPSAYFNWGFALDDLARLQSGAACRDSVDCHQNFVPVQYVLTTTLSFSLSPDRGGFIFALQSDYAGAHRFCQ